MRGLWKAALLAPALVLADWMAADLHDQVVTSAAVDVPVLGLSESPDIFTVLSFHVDVLASDHICGHGNLTVNGQELAQEPSDFASTGRGSLDIDGKTVEGSWAFYCLVGFYGPFAQRLEFSVVSVDGKFVEDVNFWVEFKQNDDHRIVSASAMDYDPAFQESVSSSEVATYEDDAENFDFERELDELHRMKDLVQDLKYEIYMKEEAIAVYLSQENLDACDSLKCVVRTVFSKARVTAHKVMSKVYEKLNGDVEFEQSMRPPWMEPHGEGPHWRKPHFPPPPHGNHSHGNHTCPGKGNHTHPRFPHPPPPPFCRCPPPPRHGHGPPHHLPPHGPPPHGPPKGSPGKRPSPPPHDGPGKPPGGPPGRHPGHPGESPHRPPPLEGGDQGQPFDDPPFDGPPFDGPPFDGPSSPSEFDKLHKIMIAAKFFAVATLFLLLVAVVHRRCCCSAARRQEKQARREERQRRRAFRRAARKHAWRSWFARHICRSTACDDLDDEEKRAILARRPTDIEEDAVASEISEFRNAVNVVSDMVAVEEGRMEGRVSMDSRATLPEYMSQLGGESLPTYEVEEGSQLSSVVADGFRYTPGSSAYTPGDSLSGSVRDVLGDMKE